MPRASQTKTRSVSTTKCWPRLLLRVKQQCMGITMRRRAQAATPEAKATRRRHPAPGRAPRGARARAADDDRTRLHSDKTWHAALCLSVALAGPGCASRVRFRARHHAGGADAGRQRQLPVRAVVGEDERDHGVSRARVRGAVLLLRLGPGTAVQGACAVLSRWNMQQQPRSNAAPHQRMMGLSRNQYVEPSTTPRTQACQSLSGSSDWLKYG
jgi:hypothetical protein